MNPASQSGGHEEAEAEAAARSPRRARGWRGVAGALIALACLAAAAWLFSTHQDELGRAVESARRAPAWLVATAIGLPLLNWGLTTASFWLLTRRVGRVGFLEMGALMGASWLANYLPLKPGLVGRVAYHRAVNGIPVRESGLVVVQAVMISALAAALLVGWVLLAGEGPAGMLAWLGGAGEAALLVWGMVHAAKVRRADAGHGPMPGMFSTATAVLGVRLADAMVWALRYLAAFAIVGSPITPVQACALSAVSQMVAALPVVGSALGVREWSVALLASVLPPGSDGAGAGAAGREAMLAAGLAADILNRGIELAWAAVVGSACGWWVGRRIAVHSRGEGGPQGPPGVVRG